MYYIVVLILQYYVKISIDYFLTICNYVELLIAL